VNERSHPLLLATLITAWVFSLPAHAGVINDPSYFDTDASFVNFDSLPAGELTNAVPGLRFSSEGLAQIGYPDFVDPADANNRFDAPMLVTVQVDGGGAPISLPHYASGIEPIGGEQPAGQFNVSDMRFDFSPPVSAFGMWFIDNDFSDVRLRAFDSTGLLLDMTVIDQVLEGGTTFRGLSSDATGIRYIIIDGNPGDPNGEMLDSTFIDDLYYMPIPEPGYLGAILLLTATQVARLKFRRVK